jgi:restriction system protein
MGRRRKESGMDIVAALPWPIGLVIGVLAYLAIRYGIGYYLSTAGGPLLRGVDSQLGESIAPLAWMALALCWIAAAASFFRSRKRRHLLDVQSDIDGIKAMPWREFEMLVGEAYRRQGYLVEETGLGGADGGIDLILRKNGRSELVQCKNWRSRQVNVSVVREMWGLVAHHKTVGAKIVCTGAFTPDAAAFADGKPIDLVTGETLVALVRSLQTSPQAASPTALDKIQTSAAPAPCPKCGASMVVRVNKRTGERFWGCLSYPRCRGTLPA